MVEEDQRLFGLLAGGDAGEEGVSFRRQLHGAVRLARFTEERTGTVSVYRWASATLLEMPAPGERDVGDYRDAT
jgi:hypothetical protein